MNKLWAAIAIAWSVSFIIMIGMIFNDIKRMRRVEKLDIIIYDKVNIIINNCMHNSINTELSVFNTTDIAYKTVLSTISNEGDKSLFIEKYGAKLKSVIYNNIINHPKCLIKLQPSEYIESDAD